MDGDCTPLLGEKLGDKTTVCTKKSVHNTLLNAIETDEDTYAIFPNFHLVLRV